MKKRNILMGLLLALCPLMGWAQEDNQFINERPECSFVGNVFSGMKPLVNGPHKILSPGAIMPVTGSPRIPIVLVEFADRPFNVSGKTAEEVRETYELFFNGFDDAAVNERTGSKGSVFSYFEEMSQGKFLPDFEIIGPVRLDNGYATYGANYSDTSRDKGIGQFYKESVEKAVKQFDVDWKEFDNNNDGRVDIVYFVHAGWGENTLSIYVDGTRTNLDPDAIWAKESPSETSVTTDEGKLIFACYGVSAEARIKDSQKTIADSKGDFAPTGYNPDNLRMDGIGVCCHEISHALGMPDFYDRQLVGYGMDVWSLMDYGNYVNLGYTPCAYNAYERNYVGWEELPVLTEPQVVTLKCFADGGHGYKVVSPYNKDEYYVLENRQPKGWDEGLCKYANGLCVTHIDYLASKWTSNRVNTLSSSTGDHYRMVPITANGEYKTRTQDGAEAWRISQGGMTFPGTTYNYNLTDDSTPAANLYNGQNVYSAFMQQPIRNITRNDDGTITLCFRTHGKLEVPSGIEAEEVSMDGFTVRWYEVENATAYEVEVETEYGSEPVVTKVTEAKLVVDGLTQDSKVRVRVRALADSPEDYIDGEWSDYVQLDTDVDYLADVPDGEKRVTVYAMNGAMVSQCYADELHRLDVHPGIYVVKYSNGASRKVILK